MRKLDYSLTLLKKNDRTTIITHKLSKKVDKD